MIDLMIYFASKYHHNVEGMDSIAARVGDSYLSSCGPYFVSRANAQSEITGLFSGT